MKKFKNQMLSKSAMNQIHGGLTVFGCHCDVDGNKPQETIAWFIPLNSTAQQIADSINAHCKGGGSCDKISA